MTHGKHRAPTHTGRTLAQIALTGAGAATLMGAAAPVASATNWDPIITCESGNQNINNASSPKSSASGYLQIIDGTWRGHGGTEFAARAIGATKAQQIIVAERIVAARGSLADWNASKKCWGPKLSASTLRAPTLPPPAAAATPGRTHTVVAGDTLARIAGPSWPSVYAANRAVIGSDPNLIFPGEVLAL
jgi:nucleoid-associated protein YgaU